MRALSLSIPLPRFGALLRFWYHREDRTRTSNTLTAQSCSPRAKLGPLLPSDPPPTNNTKSPLLHINALFYSLLLPLLWNWEITQIQYALTKHMKWIIRIYCLLKICQKWKGLEHECPQGACKPSKEMGVNPTIKGVHWAPIMGQALWYLLFHVLSNLAQCLMTMVWSKYCYSLHFRNEKTEAFRDQVTWS